MFLKKWEELPDYMRNEHVRKHYNILSKNKISLFVKRVLDIILAYILFLVFSPILAVISIAIKIDSKGPVIFCQTRITQYGRRFKIFKFRTMIENAENEGTQITKKDDKRITRIGKYLRKYRIDEIPQLINIIKGDMSFVGTRPEVVKYVQEYNDEMMATLLLPAGVTSKTSIMYKDEDFLLANAEDVDGKYINDVLPEKMKLNIDYLDKFSIFNDIIIIFSTVVNVMKKDKTENYRKKRYENTNN